MRLSVCVLCASCFTASPAPPPAKPSPDPQALTRRDLDVLCKADVAAEASIAEVFPVVTAKMNDGQLRDVLFAWRDGHLGATELFQRVRELMAEAHVAACTTLDVISAPRSATP